MHQVQNMAYVHETPWHGLGNQLPARQPIEVWAQKAGMGWQIRETPVRFMTDSTSSALIRPSPVVVRSRHNRCPDVSPPSTPPRSLSSAST